MGRPIKKIYFGNRNVPPIGGEGVASVTVGGTNDNYTAFPSIVFAAPQLPGGSTATGTVKVGIAAGGLTLVLAGTGYTANDVLTLVGGTGTAATITVDTVDTGGEILTFTLTTAGDYSALADLTDLAVTGGTGNDDATFTITALKINSVVVTSSGSGYSSAPAITDTPDGNATLTAVLSSVSQNAIAISAYIPAGSSAVTGDIVKQEASRRYLVTTAQGTGQCRLVAAAPAAGEMTMTAVDSAGGTYYVTKLTAKKALLVKGDRTGTQFTDGTTVKWSFDAAVLNESVQLLSV